MGKIKLMKSEIKELFKNDASGHDFWHTMRVYNIAMKIAEAEACDKRIVAYAALLHDVDDAKLYDTEDYANARGIMKKVGIGDKEAERVVSVIKTVPFLGIDTVQPPTIEGKIVQDADRLDALGAIGIARTFAYGGSKGLCIYDPKIKPKMNLSAMEYTNNRGTSINHFYEKLFQLKYLMNTKKAKKLAKKRDKIVKEYIDNFFDEWNCL